MPKRFRPECKRDVGTMARRGDLVYAEVADDFDARSSRSAVGPARPTSTTVSGTG
jgi:hypothetical protein